MNRCKWCGRKLTDVEAMCNDSVCPDCIEVLSDAVTASRLRYPVWLCYCFVACILTRVKKSKGIKEVCKAVGVVLGITAVVGIGIWLILQILRLLLFIFLAMIVSIVWIGM